MERCAENIEFITATYLRSIWLSKNMSEEIHVCVKSISDEEVGILFRSIWRTLQAQNLYFMSA
jgi:hypothetical protein